MKGIVLRDFEVRRLASAGSVLIWRRVNPQPKPPSGTIIKAHDLEGGGFGFFDEDRDYKCPFGATGETRWVKETWRSWDEEQRIIYKADYQPIEMKMRWKSPTTMPEEASRFRVTLTVSCRRIQSVTEEEAERSGAEFGFWHPDQRVFSSPVDEEDEDNSCFRDGLGFLIESRHTGSWERNEFHWAIEAKGVK